MSLASSQSSPGVDRIDGHFDSAKIELPELHPWLPRGPLQAQALLSGARYLLAKHSTRCSALILKLCTESGQQFTDILSLVKVAAALLAQPGNSTRKLLGVAFGGTGKRLPTWKSILATFFEVEEGHIWALLGLTIVLPADFDTCGDFSDVFFGYLWSVLTLAALMSPFDTEGSQGFCLWSFQFELRADFSLILNPWQPADSLVLFSVRASESISASELASGALLRALRLELQAADLAARESPPFSVYHQRTEPSHISTLRARASLANPKPVYTEMLELYSVDPAAFYKQCSLQVFRSLEGHQAPNAALSSDSVSTLQRDHAALLAAQVAEAAAAASEIAKLKAQLDKLKRRAASAAAGPSGGSVAPSLRGKRTMPFSSVGSRSVSASSDVDSELSDSDESSSLVVSQSASSYVSPSMVPPSASSSISSMALVVKTFKPKETYLSLAYIRFLLASTTGLPLCLLHGTVVSVTCSPRKAFQPFTMSVTHSADESCLVDVPIRVTFPQNLAQLTIWLTELRELASTDKSAGGHFVFPYLKFVTFILAQKVPLANKVVTWARLILFVVSIMNYALSADDPVFFDVHYIRQKFEQEVTAELRVSSTATDLQDALVIGGFRCIFCKCPGGFSYMQLGVLHSVCSALCKGVTSSQQASKVPAPSSPRSTDAARYFREIQVFLGPSHTGAISAADHDRFRKQSTKFPVGGPVFSRSDIRAAPSKPSVVESYLQAVTRLALDQSSIQLDGY